MPRLTIRLKLQVFALVTLLLFGAIIYLFVIPLIEQEKRREREAKLRAVVEVAISLIDYYENGIRTYAHQRDSTFPASRAQARKRVVETLRQIRYGSDEHVFILDGAHTMVMHPLKERLEGRDMRDAQSPDGSYPFREMVLRAQRDDSAFVHYTWLSKWSQSVYEPQTTYAEFYYPWNWVVCSSVYTQDITDAVRDLMYRTGLVLLLGAAAAWALLYVISRLITRPIEILSRKVGRIGGELDRTVESVEVGGNDEVGDLARAFNRMLHRLSRAMREVRENEENIRITLNSIGDAVISTDTLGRVTRMNPVAEKLTGWQAEEAAGRQLDEVFSIVDSRTGKTAENPVQKALETRRIVGMANHTALISRDGVTRQIADSGAPILDDHGEVTGVVLVFRDVTEEYARRERLLASEERFRTIFNSVNDALIIHDVDSPNILEVNKKMLDMYGYATREEALHCSLDSMSAGEGPYTAARALELMEKARTSNEPQQFEWRARKKNGALFWVEINVQKTMLLGNERFLVMIRDITLRKQLQEQIRQTEKLEAVGQLAGGIAHDFNNQLAGMMGFADLLRLQLEDRPELRELALDIVKAIRGASQLTGQLLAFARRGSVQHDPVDIHELIQEVLDLLRHSVDKNIEFRLLLDAADHVVIGDRTQLQNTLLNLALNARDAMPQGGSVVFATQVVDLDEGFCRRKSTEARPGRYLRISVADTGHGMDKSVLSRVFEPFFTTKKPGKGTGMGLASAFGAVKSHKGIIDVYSEPGKGTEFKLFLPLAMTVAPAPLPVRGASSNQTRSGTVMLVDDEETLRRTGARMLSSLGYSVITCTSGDEALEQYRKRSRDIVGVILDMVMPGMSGPETFAMLRTINPNVAVLVVSGYSMREDIREILRAGARDFLQKPYSFEDLASKTGELFGTEGEGEA
jgi:PAS domain S-box-containing protein